MRLSPPGICQSAYRPGHSTVTALLKVVNDLFLSPNKGNISVLALLHFSSAIDTIDHPILVHRLHIDIGFTDAIGVVVRMSILDTKVDGSIPSINKFSP